MRTRRILTAGWALAIGVLAVAWSQGCLDLGSEPSPEADAPAEEPTVVPATEADPEAGAREDKDGQKARKKAGNPMNGTDGEAPRLLPATKAGPVTAPELIPATKSGILSAPVEPVPQQAQPTQQTQP